MGGSDPVAPTPAAAPSSQETSAQAIQAQIDALPKILQAQQQYGPQFSQTQLDLLNQYSGQFAQQNLDLQKQYQPQYQELQYQLNPELKGAQDNLTTFLNGNDTADYNALAPGILDQVRAGQSQRGIGAISPLGSIDESVQLAQLKQSLKDRRLNIALSTAGRQPIGQTTVAQNTTGTGQLVQNVDPNSMFTYQNGLNNFNASIYGSQTSAYNTQLSTQGDPWGSILGGISGGLSGGLSAGLGSKLGGTALAMCWVAAEIFNEPMDGPTVCNARKFIINDAPRWFRDWYRMNGERFAQFIHNKPLIKNLLRPIFSYMAKKGAI